MSEPVCNVSRHLTRMAERMPGQQAVIDHALGQALTFAQLEVESNRVAHGLVSFGIRRQMRVLVMVKPGLEFTTVIFALLKIGALPVLIDPGMGLGNVLRCVGHIRPEALIGVPLVHVVRRLKPAPFRSITHAVTVGGRWWPGAVSLQQLRQQSPSHFTPAPTVAGENAAILFTSGSTGPAKGVVYQHGMFEAQVQAIRQHYRMEPGEIELATFALFALFCPALGMTCVFPEMDFARPGRADPDRIIDAIRRYAVTNAFGSPALWNRVSRHAEQQGIRLPSMRRILIAGAPVDWRIVQRLKSCLDPRAEVFTPYGATEALPVASIGAAELLGDCVTQTRRGKGICVGRVVGGQEVRIIAMSDEPIEQWASAEMLPPGQVGEIVVSGAVVTREYCELAEENRRAKIHDADVVWHRLGDVGYFDDQGRLWYCGRKAHCVHTAAGMLLPECVEALFNEHPKVQRSALVGAGPAGGQHPAMVIEAVPNCGRKETLREELRILAGQHELTRGIEKFFFHEPFPVDVRHNAKIDREWLARWVERRWR